MDGLVRLVQFIQARPLQNLNPPVDHHFGLVLSGQGEFHVLGRGHNPITEVGDNPKHSLLLAE